MSIQRETYAELVHAMIVSLVQEKLNFGQVSSVLWACAQPSTEESTIDVTHKVREALDDWSELDKGMLIGVETVILAFDCSNIHGPCEKGRHAVAMTRVIGSRNWDPDRVQSQHNFNQTILDATMHVHPDGPNAEGKVNTIHNKGGLHADLISAFRDMFMQQPEKRIDKEVDDFRAELDKLFPSTPGKEEGT